MEVFKTVNFSRSVQSLISASSIAMLFLGGVSLYKYNKRSSGVKFVIGNPLMSIKKISVLKKKLKRPVYKRGYVYLIVLTMADSSHLRVFPVAQKDPHCPFS